MLVIIIFMILPDIAPIKNNAEVLWTPIYHTSAISGKLKMLPTAWKKISVMKFAFFKIRKGQPKNQ